MTINTGISPLLAVPQTMHTFTTTPAAAGLTPLPLNLGMIGAMRATGLGVAGTVYEITSVAHAETLFGLSSELALMCRKYFETAARFGKGPRPFAVGIAEPGGGTANVKTLTAVGSATADGNIIVRVAGRTIPVGVRSGDVQNTIASRISDALKAVQDALPVLISYATNVVTATHPTKGVNGGDVKITVDQQVPGCVVTVANTAVGAGVTDHQTALDAFAPMPIDAIAFANHAAADITEINADILARWGYAEKAWRWYFVGEPGSIGTATPLATAANHTACLIGSYEGCPNTAGEIAVVDATTFLSREQPNAGYNGVEVPLYPPDAATVYTKTEQETAIAAGLIPHVARIDKITRNVIGSTSKIVRMVTTKTTSNSLPWFLQRDVGVSRTGCYLARQYDIAYEQRFGANAEPNGALADEDKPSQVKNMIKAIHRLAGEAKIIKNVEADLAVLRVEPSNDVPGRFDVEPQYTPITPLHQLAVAHRVRVG